MRGLIALLLLPLGGACGLGWFEEASGGGENLPTSASGPYGKPEVDFDTPADEPFVIDDRAASLVAPTVLPRDDGGFRFWFGREPNNTTGLSEIWRAELADVFDLPDVEPVASMAPDQAWEGTRVTRPAVVEGDPGQLVMYYEGGPEDAPAIGRAESFDGGATWQKHPGNPVLGQAGDPGAVVVDGQWMLYVVRTGMAGIYRGTSADGVAFSLDAEPVIRPRALAGAFDRAGVASPSVVAEITPANQLHFSMLFNGVSAADDVAIGYAGSFDGVRWERFNGLEPVLTPGSPTEHGPTGLVAGTRAYLFYNQLSGGRQRIGVALHP
ncbi:MAG TPA: hypothetical protein VML75_25375 [Kofleriaceae bacterium]|nr:hypothetical protein [Kofleriaceae bacterium]